MQFLPGGAKQPNVAIHFGMLEYLNKSKKVAQMSNHSFSEIQNLTNKVITNFDH